MKKYNSEAEIYENHRINHLRFLENLVYDIHMIIPQFKSIDSKYSITYLKAKLNDIKKVKATLQFENKQQTNEIQNFENIKKEIFYEINIVNRDINEMQAEKIKFEEELSKLKVIINNIAGFNY